MEASKTAKIMLVEDDATMRRVLMTLLELEGYEVSMLPERNGGAELLEMIQSAMPNMILLDVHLQNQNLSGIDLLKLIRANPALASIKIYMTSGMMMRDQCMEAGANGFLLKPYMPDELLKLLKS